MTIEVPRVSPDWLRLREPADAAARSTELVDHLRRRLGQQRLVIHDLGSGTGSMTRWLAPLLPGPQHWVLYDRDPDLLEIAAKTPVDAPVTVETRQRDVTRLTDEDLAGASLITGSALLDMWTANEVERVVAACHRAGCPVLLTISVVGRVELTPADPLDASITEAFNAHQRRTVAGRTLLGPDAVDAAAAAFRRRGVPVMLRPSPWRIGADPTAGGTCAGQGRELAAEWLRGWLDAACEQQRELTLPLVEYVSRRFAQAEAGQLGVVVHHADLLAGCE